MFKLERIFVDNFKNLTDTELILGDFNVLVGPNNSGKTNLLQVLPFLKMLIQGDQDSMNTFMEFGSANRHRYVPFDQEKKVGLMKIEISFSHIESNFIYDYEIEIPFKAKSEHHWQTPIEIQRESFHAKNRSNSGPRIRIFERVGYTTLYGSSVLFSKNFGKISNKNLLLRLWNTLEFEKEEDFVKNGIKGINELIATDIFYFSSFEIKKSYIEGGAKNSFLDRLMLPKIDKSIISIKDDEQKYEVLRSILKSFLNIDDVSILVSNPEDEKLNWNVVQPKAIFFQYGNALTLYSFSDGTVLFIAFIIEILTSDNSLFLIEEPENSLHPSALKALIEFMRDRTPEKQFILTTHSPYLLNMVKPEEIFVGSVNEKGEAKFEPVSDIKELRRKLAKGFMSLGDYLEFNMQLQNGGKEKVY